MKRAVLASALVVFALGGCSGGKTTSKSESAAKTDSGKSEAKSKSGKTKSGKASESKSGEPATTKEPKQPPKQPDEVASKPIVRYHAFKG